MLQHFAIKDAAPTFTLKRLITRRNSDVRGVPYFIFLKGMAEQQYVLSTDLFHFITCLKYKVNKIYDEMCKE
jgi:hypothetical protein